MSQQAGQVTEWGAGVHSDRSGGRLGAGAIASIGALAVLAIFMVQNRDKVEIEFLAWDFTWALWLVALFSALFGALVWFGLGVMRRHSRRQARRD